jgi:DNA topoisomerase-3
MSHNSSASEDMNGPDPPPPRPAPKSNSLAPPSNPASTSNFSSSSRSTATSKSVQPPAPPRASSSSTAEVKCRCGTPAGDRTTLKEGPNKGRRFWVCGDGGKCEFFEWMDGPSSLGTSGSSANGGQGVVPQKRSAPERAVSFTHSIRCKCNRDTHSFLCRTQYSGPAASSSPYAQSASDGPTRMCRCDMTAVQRTVMKEGPNQGRKFWACPNSEKARCGYFEWDDEPSGTGAGGNGSGSQARGSGGGGQSGECYKVCTGAWEGSLLTDTSMMLVWTIWTLGELYVHLPSDHRDLIVDRHTGSMHWQA